ncbi:MAG TPA: wax ester/triacylglycerol synthase domain-containing protein [Mycobacterium sp.]|nr:wax ester/triacylglycerol synthase domain-containing protein [Mycobacterium sp.]HTH91806.1 wax ester/triacylglycerol synthase domain-containing protein [Mycobacterium sp.]
MTKVHHAAVDGVTGASLLSKLCSVDPDVAPAPVDGGGSAGPLQIAAGGLVRFASRPWQLASVLPATAATSASNSAHWSGSMIMRRKARWESRPWESQAAW